VLEYLTAILVFVTAIYSYITFKILQANRAVVDEMQKQSEAVFRPYMTVRPFIPDGSIVVYLAVKNEGKTPANNLRLKIDRDFFMWGRKDLKESNLAQMAAFQEEIDCFPPKQELIFALGTGPTLFGEKADLAITPRAFNISATYKYSNKQIVESTSVDLKPFLGTLVKPSPIVEGLKEISDAVKKLEK
jgi:hypothetical protein